MINLIKQVKTLKKQQMTKYCYCYLNPTILIGSSLSHFPKKLFSLVNFSNLLHYEDTFISHFVNLSNLRGKEKCI